MMRGLNLAWLGALALLGCATPVEPAPLGPTLGHSQPLPPEPDPDRPSPPPRPTPGIRIVVTPDPVPEPSAEPDTTEPAPADEAKQADTASSIAPATAEDEELCRHITRVVLTESGNAAGLTGEQVDELIASCSLTLAQDRRTLDPAEFRRRADCVRAASSVAEFSTCN